MDAFEFAGSERRFATTAENIPMIVGSDILVAARGGRMVRGRCVKAWPLRSGGLALTVRLADGSGLKHLSTLQPIAVLSGRH